MSARRLLLNLSAVLVLAFLAGAAHAMPPEGEAAPDFSLADIYDENSSHSLSEFRGRAVLINIWASWCTTCKEEMPGFVDLQAAYGKDRFVLIAVNIDKRKSRALNFLEKLGGKADRGGINFLVLYDGQSTVARQYNPLGMPTSFLIGKEGKLLKSYVGSFDSAGFLRLRQDIDRLMGSGQ